MLIAIEGIDGSGKTTQVDLLAEALTQRGIPVVQSKEPTNGPHGTRLRQSAITGRLSPEKELELFILDRKEHVANLIRPNLARNTVVILDRYYFSTIAYQSARGLDADDIRCQNEEFAPQPDLLLIVKVPVEASLDRIGLRDGQGNEFEKKENLESCDQRFDQFEGDFVRRIDGSLAIEEVHQQILTAVTSHPKFAALTSSS